MKLESESAEKRTWARRCVAGGRMPLAADVALEEMCMSWYRSPRIFLGPLEWKIYGSDVLAWRFQTFNQPLWPSSVAAMWRKNQSRSPHFSAVTSFPLLWSLLLLLIIIIIILRVLLRNHNNKTPIKSNHTANLLVIYSMSITWKFGMRTLTRGWCCCLLYFLIGTFYLHLFVRCQRW